MHDEAGGFVTLFLLNRHLSEEMPLEVSAGAFAGFEVADATAMHDGDLAAVNTREQPDRIQPAVLTGVTVEGATVAARLPPASGSVIRLATRE